MCGRNASVHGTLVKGKANSMHFVQCIQEFYVMYIIILIFKVFYILMLDNKTFNNTRPIFLAIGIGKKVHFKTLLKEPSFFYDLNDLGLTLMYIVSVNAPQLHCHLLEEEEMKIRLVFLHSNFFFFWWWWVWRRVNKTQYTIFYERSLI